MSMASSRSGRSNLAILRPARVTDPAKVAVEGRGHRVQFDVVNLNDLGFERAE
jgi:hypothetical protein